VETRLGYYLGQIPR